MSRLQYAPQKHCTKLRSSQARVQSHAPQARKDFDSLPQLTPNGIKPRLRYFAVSSLTLRKLPQKLVLCYARNNNPLTP